MNKSVVLKIFNNIHIKAGRNQSSWSPLAIAFNNRPQNKINLSLIKVQSGLFDVEELTSVEGFYALQERCVSKSDALVAEAVSDNRRRKLVEVFDELSDTLCKVADLAEFIRIAHPSKVYADAAEIACGAVTGVVEKLNTNNKLYGALNYVAKNGDKMPTSTMDDHVSRLFLFDFEQSGIHLPEAERHQVVALNDAILQLGQTFVTGCSKARALHKDILPEYVKQIFPTDERGNIIIAGLHADSTNPVAREIAYRTFMQPDSHQSYLLDELLTARHRLATICGFSSFRARALRGGILETPGSVNLFLERLADGLKTRAARDFDTMTEMKRADSHPAAVLGVWDVPYYTQRYKQKHYQLNSADYSPYFSLGACMDGLSQLFKSLYGITLECVELEAGEAWCGDLYKVAVRHETEGALGHIYCDFYEREHKPHQDCHFTIRGGKQLPNGSYQQPIVVLMLNLPMPRWSTPALLTPSQLENLYHEMGHAMHSMLARTRYQHVTGTRCSTDLAEVPSVLMEYFAGDERVVARWARHYRTGEPMPEKMVRAVCEARRVFGASEMQLQAFYAALDQRYHDRHPLIAGTAGKEGMTTTVLAEVQERYYNIPYVPNTAWQLRFSHLYGYGAKYYSYLVSKALASWIWSTRFAGDPFNREQGERYRRECLAHGGSKPAGVLISEFLQRDATAGHLADNLLAEIDSKRLVK